MPSVHAPLASLPPLAHLFLSCPYDAATIPQLADCLSAILPRPDSLFHSQLYLIFDKYPHYTEPTMECWRKLDKVVRDNVQNSVNVDCRVRQCDPHEPVVWGDLYRVRWSDEWFTQAMDRFYGTFSEGRLWAWGSCKMWRHLR